MHTILLYYNYTSIEHPEALMKEQREICERLGLKGRILISKEGINGTVEGIPEAIEAYKAAVRAIPGCDNTHFKESEGTGTAFPKLVVKVREEIVSTHLGKRDIDPNKTTGNYLQAEELHEWFESGKEFYIVDMRNDYEFEVGHFENSIFSGMAHFRDLPEIIKDLDHLKDKTVLTVCTGGVRCEKASGFLVENGFKDVHQLYGGIVTYMEKYPNEHFLGKLYVFDGRVVMGFNTDDPKHKVIGTCKRCNEKSERYVNCSNLRCHKHFICCEDCGEEGKTFCKDECEQVVANAK